MDSDDPCPVYTFHMNGSDGFYETLALNNSDKRYSSQGYLSPQLDNYPMSCLVVCQHNKMQQG